MSGRNIILAKQMFDGFYSSDAYDGAYIRGCNFPESGVDGSLKYSFTLEVGKSYIVVWDDEEFPVIGQDASALMDGAVALGNLGAFGLDGNNEPFALATIAGTGVTFMSITETVDSHTIAIYQAEETPLLLDTEFNFSYTESFGVFAYSDLRAEFFLAADQKYTIIWDGKKYARDAFAFISADGSVCVGVGNPIAAGKESNGDAFCVVYDVTHSYVHYMSLDQNESHTVSICRLAERFSDGSLVLPEVQYDGFVYDQEANIYTLTTTENSDYPVLDLIANETYTIYWDGDPYVCVAEAVQADGVENGLVFVGNMHALGLTVGNTDAPFIIGSNGSENAFTALYDSRESHSISIYYGISTIHNKTVLLPKTALSSFEQDNTGFYGAAITPAPFLMEPNEEYVIVWDGTEYNVTAIDIGDILDGAVFAGNGANFIAPDSGEPFALTTYSDSEYSDVVFYALQDYDKEHTVAVYSADSDVFLPKTTFEDSNNIACNKMLTAGDTYRVLFDDVEYIVIAQDISEDDLTVVAVFEGEISNPEWIFATAYVDGESRCLLGANYDEGSHTIAIYYADEGQTPDDPLDPEPDEPVNPDDPLDPDPDEPVNPDPDEPVNPEEPETREGIILKDRNGKDVAYYGIETVTFDTTTEGKRQVYSKGTVSDNMEVVPDFSNGDMDVSPSDADMTRSVTILAPDDLKPENVRKGKEIAGVPGVFIGDTEEIVVGESDGLTPLDFSSGAYEVIPSADDKVISRVIIEKPSALRPESIARGIEICGIVGTYGEDFDMSDENLRFFSYQVNTERKEITLFSVDYSAIYEATGNYDVAIPNKIGGYDVIINACS